MAHIGFKKKKRLQPKLRHQAHDQASHACDAMCHLQRLKSSTRRPLLFNCIRLRSRLPEPRSRSQGQPASLTRLSGARPRLAGLHRGGAAACLRARVARAGRSRQPGADLGAGISHAGVRGRPSRRPPLPGAFQPWSRAREGPPWSAGALRGRSAGHAPRRDARFQGPDRAAPGPRPRSAAPLPAGRAVRSCWGGCPQRGSASRARPPSPRRRPRP
jgi:hypothetical protein